MIILLADEQSSVGCGEADGRLKSGQAGGICQSVWWPPKPQVLLGGLSRQPRDSEGRQATSKVTRMEMAMSLSMSIDQATYIDAIRSRSVVVARFRQVQPGGRGCGCGG